MRVGGLFVVQTEERVCDRQIIRKDRQTQLLTLKMHVAFQLCGSAKDAFEPPVLVLLEFYQPKVKQKKNGEPHCLGILNNLVST